MRYLLSVLVVCTAALAAPEMQRAVLPRLAKAPTVDGTIAAGEWDEALETTGFLSIGQAQLQPRLGHSFAAYSGDTLYVAVVSPVPPTGVIAQATERDGTIIHDSCIEVWVDPNRGTRGDPDAPQEYYQFIGNSAGAFRDVSLTPGGTPNVGWNGKWTVANTVSEDGTWTAEVAIPFSEFGWAPGSAAGRTLGLLTARNYKYPWQQLTWYPHRGAFIAWQHYVALELAPAKPVVRLESLGGPALFGGALAVRLAVRNPAPAARQVRVAMTVTSSDMPGIEEEKVLDLPAGGSAVYEHTVKKGRLHTDATHTLALAVTAADGAESYFHYGPISWTQAPPPHWTVEAGPKPEEALRLAYYPSLHRLRVRAEPAHVSADLATATAATVRVLDPDGAVVHEAPLTLGPDAVDVAKPLRPNVPPPVVGTSHVGIAEYDLPVLADGEYRVEVTVGETVLAKPFPVRTFAWQGNKLGITDKVYPPFEPVTVADRTVNVVQRRYRLGSTGFWESVRSVGEELLAAPIALVANGVRLEGPLTVGAPTPQAVRHEAELASPAVTVRLVGTTEYDGCLKVELELAPGTEQAALTDLYLDMPLRDAACPLWHVTTTGLRTNPAGDAPAGTGRVWASTDYPDGEWYGSFKPYIWVGGPTRGLAWFADNDAGWVVDPKAAAITLHRDHGVLALRIHLVQAPTTITAARRVVFGLMASPGKPLPADWRAIGRPGHRNIGFSMGFVYGMTGTYNAKYPIHKDFSSFDKAQEYRTTGNTAGAGAFVDYWAAKNLDPAMDESLRARFRQLLGLGLGRGKGAGHDGFTAYFEEFHSTSIYHEECPVYQSEWSGAYRQDLPPEPLVQDDMGRSIRTGGIVPSYRDFACWFAAEWLRRGIGCYFDNSFPLRAYDPLTTSAYRLPDGRIQPSAGMWARREYLRRIWVLHQQLRNPDYPPAMMIHMTNTHILPYMVWNEVNLDLEWRYGPEPQQSKYAADMLRAESTGRQTGNIPFVLARVANTTGEEQQAKAERTRMGTMLVHEIKVGIGNPRYPDCVVDFGYGLPNCDVFDYWQPDYPLTPSNDQAKTLLLRRNGELFVVVCTWNPRPETATLTLDLDALGVRPTRAVNAETGAPLPWADGRLTLDLPEYGVAYVRLGK